MPKYKKYLFPLIIIIIFLYLYHPVLTTYFTQDDFFHFKIAQTDGSIAGLLYLTDFHPFSERGIAFYRPLFRDLLYHFSYITFNLNHYPLRILSFIIHLINGYLTFTLINKLFKNKFHAYFTSFFYIIGASNVASLYYLAGGIQVLGALMFILLTLLNFINYLNTKKKIYFVYTFITFLMSLASHEQSFILPFLLTGLILVSKPRIKIKNAKQIQALIKYLRSYIKIIIPFFLILSIYLFLNYQIIGYSKNEIQYQAQIDPKRTVNSLIWYSGWAIGLPEMLIDFAPSLIKIDPRLMQYWGNYFKIILPAFFISLGILLYMTFKLLYRNIKLFIDPKLLMLIGWYIAGLIPVIFLPFHKSGHYLTVVLPAFWGIIGFVVSQYLNLLKKYITARILIVFLTTLLLILSSTSAILGKNFYWAAQRGKLAEKLINMVKSQYPSVPKGSIIYFQNDPNYPFVAEDWGGASKQAYYALNGKDALQLLYNDNSLIVLYEDINKIDSKNNNLIFPIITKIY